jgi:hypothetical protein
VQTISLATDTISLASSQAAIVLVTLFNNSGAITLTSLPNVVNGAFDGQIALLRGSGPSTIIIQTEGTLPGSGLFLAAAANKSITQRDVISLLWDQATLKWWQSTTIQAN